MFDYHIHTKLCCHAEGEMEEYVKYAIKIGMEEMGFSDHIPWEYLPENLPRQTWGMSENQLDSYFSEINRLQKVYSDKICIKAGMELDYLAWNEEKVLEFIDKQKYRLDYIIGSVHMIESPKVGIWAVDYDELKENYQKIGIDEVYNQYFDHITELVKTKSYNIIGHLDLVKKYGYRPSNKTLYLKKITKLLSLIKENGYSIECSTAGLRKQVAEIYPEPDILKIAIQKGVPITLNSDSHKPTEIGFNFSETLSLLKKMGLKHLCKYKKGKQELVSI
jgi:histidinol-phosphatase (PHP family)